THDHPVHPSHGRSRHPGGSHCHHLPWEAVLCGFLSVPQDPAGNGILSDAGEEGLRSLCELLPLQQHRLLLQRKSQE
ncbi:hypothetical protein M9458_001015, partial [Cirrhinus mrigala]